MQGSLSQAHLLLIQPISRSPNPQQLELCSHGQPSCWQAGTATASDVTTKMRLRSILIGTGTLFISSVAGVGGGRRGMVRVHGSESGSIYLEHALGASGRVWLGLALGRLDLEPKGPFIVCSFAGARRGQGYVTEVGDDKQRRVS